MFVGVFAIALGLLGGISTPAYLSLMPVGATVLVSGFFALLGLAVLAVLLLVTKSIRR